MLQWLHEYHAKQSLRQDITRDKDGHLIMKSKTFHNGKVDTLRRGESRKFWALMVRKEERYFPIWSCPLLSWLHYTSNASQHDTEQQAWNSHLTWTFSTFKSLCIWTCPCTIRNTDLNILHERLPFILQVPACLQSLSWILHQNCHHSQYIPILKHPLLFNNHFDISLSILSEKKEPSFFGSHF